MGPEESMHARGRRVPMASEPTRWRKLAAFRGRGPATFFAPAVGDARGHCASCPVEEICFWYALATEEETGYRFGIWGRTTPAQRAYIATLIGIGYAHRRLAVVLAACHEPLAHGPEVETRCPPAAPRRHQRSAASSWSPAPHQVRAHPWAQVLVIVCNDAPTDHLARLRVEVGCTDPLPARIDVKGWRAGR